MKNLNRTLKLLYFIIIVTTLFGCDQYSFESGPGTVSGQKIESTTTIASLKSVYMISPDQFTADRISSPTDLVINGIVTSTDIEGNIYKYIAVQEEIAGGHAIRISIDAAGLSALYPVGQRVSVVVNDLCIGKYGESPQVGVYYVRPKDSQVSPGAIPMPIARRAVIAYGQPQPTAVIADTMTIAEILATPRNEMDYKLVCIKNVWFTGKGYDRGAPVTLVNKDKIFAPSTNGIGYPQLREIQDGTGSAAIATSEYARFAKKNLPESTYNGNVTAIVSWYRKGSGVGNYQLTIRTLGDLGDGFEGYLKQIGYIK